MFTDRHPSLRQRALLPQDQYQVLTRQHCRIQSSICIRLEGIKCTPTLHACHWVACSQGMTDMQAAQMHIQATQLQTGTMALETTLICSTQSSIGLWLTCCLAVHACSCEDAVLTSRLAEHNLHDKGDLTGAACMVKICCNCELHKLKEIHSS